MGKEYPSEELATRTFTISMAGVSLFIAVVFAFILL